VSRIEYLLRISCCLILITWQFIRGCRQGWPGFFIGLPKGAGFLIFPRPVALPTFELAAGGHIAGRWPRVSSRACCFALSGAVLLSSYAILALATNQRAVSELRAFRLFSWCVAVFEGVVPLGVPFVSFQGAAGLQ
jgi:hypothetical protein